MGSFEKFEEYLSDGLNHLYDPAYQPPELLWTVTGDNPHNSKQGGKSVQSAIINAIEGLKPSPDVPRTARIRRIYDVLQYRYLQGLTQEKAAERLNITPRHLRREQQQAIHILAQHLWEQSHLELPLADEPSSAPTDPVATEPDEPPTTWRSQVKEELASLRQTTPDVMANVSASLAGAVNVGQILASKHGSTLTVAPVDSTLTTTIHPSVLRQVFITAIEKLVQHITAGEITLQAEKKSNSARIKVVITGRPAITGPLPSSEFIEESLSAQGGEVQVQAAEDHFVFELDLPAADKKITVLVVDDNADLVNFYRHYTTRTQYQIIHLAEGRRIFETIASSPPDIIVLDVMLPDVDGWELLTTLHEHPATRTIPVIVCSVVKRQELASALGAALYLPKPVRRQQFIQALEQVLNRGSTGGTRAEGNSSITY
jgi:CheY-like chemotaxis protein